MDHVARGDLAALEEPARPRQVRLVDIALIRVEPLNRRGHAIAIALHDVAESVTAREQRQQHTLLPVIDRAIQRRRSQQRRLRWEHLLGAVSRSTIRTQWQRRALVSDQTPGRIYRNEPHGLVNG